MRTKALLTSILLGSLSLAGVASANPLVRDHRYRPAVTVQPAVQVRYDYRTTQQPTTYGYQISANGQWAQGYTYGNDPYVEGIARGEWCVLESNLTLQGRRSVRVDLNGRAVRSVELQALKGSADIIDIGILYRDGHQGSIRIDRSLDATHAPNLRLDLGASGLTGINALVVEGTGNLSFRAIGG